MTIHQLVFLQQNWGLQILKGLRDDRKADELEYLLSHCMLTAFRLNFERTMFTFSGADAPAKLWRFFADAFVMLLVKIRSCLVDRVGQLWTAFKTYRFVVSADMDEFADFDRRKSLEMQKKVIPS